MDRPWALEWYEGGMLGRRLPCAADDANSSLAALICVALLLCQLCHSPSLARVTLDGLCHIFHNAMGISQEELTPA